MNYPQNMTFIKRLHLRENWSLWVTGAVFSLVLLRLLINQLYPVEWSFETSIVYPLVIFYEYMFLPLTCTSLLVFLPVLLNVTKTGKELLYVVILTLVSSVLFCKFSSGIIEIIIPIFFLIISLIFAQSGFRKRLIPLAFATISLVLLIIPFFKAITQIEHIESVQFGDKTYNLSSLTYSDWDICISHTLVVYECDNLGFVCYGIHKTRSYSECPSFELNEFPEKTHLFADLTSNTLYLEVDDTRFSIPIASK